MSCLYGYETWLLIPGEEHTMTVFWRQDAG